MIDKTILKFIFAGIINTLFGYIIFSVIFYLLGQKELSLALAFIIAVLFNYLTIGFYVFESSYNSRRLIIFFSIYVFIFLLNLVHLWVAVDFFEFNVYLSQLATILYLPALSYVLNKKYVFY